MDHDLFNKVQWHGSRAYAFCFDCKKFVWVNKPLFGALHSCSAIGRK